MMKRYLIMMLLWLIAAMLYTCGELTHESDVRTDGAREEEILYQLRSA
jgi:hypothetical protein